MGLMSNGDGTQSRGVNQLIEFCHIHHNGNLADPGYNHNFYMGGTSLTIRGCDVHDSLTGHNIKSRAHFNQIEYCFIHDSANRELDLVDHADDTTSDFSHSVLIGNVVVKADGMSGNKHTIHFGQDGGNDHNGRLWLVNNTIITPYISPVVTLSATGAAATISNNIIFDNDNGQTGQSLVAVTGGASLANVDGGNNWLPYGMSIEAGTLIDTGSIHTAETGEVPPFINWSAADPQELNFRLAMSNQHIVDQGYSWAELPVPTGPGLTPFTGLHWQYRTQASREPRGANGTPDFGAYELTY
jgi:hypothetical protein